MWWKRILYYLLIIVLGIGITTLSGSIAFNALSIDLVEKANKENNYTTIENYFNYITVPDTSKFVKEDVSDVHVEIYPSIVTQPYYKKNLDGSYAVKYDIIEEAICFSFFHLPKDYKYDGNNGKISLFLDNSNTIDLMFNNLNAEEDAINYHINFISYVELYYSFSIYITYNDFISHGGTDSSLITGLKMFDGNNNQTLEMNMATPFGFVSSFHDDFHEACQNYREYILLYGEAHSVTTYERKYALKDKIDEVAKNNPEKYLTQPSTTTVLNTTPFILTISLTASIYISIAIVVSWNIFHRKKSY